MTGWVSLRFLYKKLRSSKDQEESSIKEKIQGRLEIADCYE